MTRLFAGALLLVLVLFALLGLSMPVHMAHDGACPFAAGEVVLCSTPLAHLQRWQTVFGAIVLSLFVFAAVLPVVVRFDRLRVPRAHALYRYRPRAPHRRSLLEELISSGVIHGKIPDRAARPYLFTSSITL